MLQSVVARLVEREGASRSRMTLLAGGLAWIIGLGSVLSFNIWSGFTPLRFIDLLQDATIFRIIDFFVVNNLILTSAFFMSIFVGWTMSKQATCDEFGMGDGGWACLSALAFHHALPGTGGHPGDIIDDDNWLLARTSGSGLAS